jgi:hypothetical protein
MWREKLFLTTVYQEVPLSSNMSGPSKITATDLPHSGSANSSKKRAAFAELAHDDSLAADNAAVLPSGAARCCAYKKGSDIRCSRPAYPGSLFCSQDHSGWDTKANGTTHRVYTEADIDEDGAPQATPENLDGESQTVSLRTREINQIQLPRSCLVLFKVSLRSLLRMPTSPNLNRRRCFPGGQRTRHF